MRGVAVQALCALQSSTDAGVHSMGPEIHAIEGNLSSSQGDFTTKHHTALLP